MSFASTRSYTNTRTCLESSFYAHPPQLNRKPLYKLRRRRLAERGHNEPSSVACNYPYILEDSTIAIGSTGRDVKLLDHTVTQLAKA